MRRWLSVIRGMIGTGLTFAAGVGVVGSAIAGIVWLIPGSGVGRETIRVVVASAFWSFLIGVAFSGMLAVTARGRAFDKLSLRRFAGLGVAGGLLLYGVLAANAYHAWTVSTALVNLTIFVVLGGGTATAALLLARRARPALEPGDASPDPGVE
jgi:hypothetical protein